MTAKEAREIAENLNPENNKLFDRILNDINEAAKSGKFKIYIINKLFNPAIERRLANLGYEIITEGTLHGIPQKVIYW